jgi:Domain of unknown function (DUF4384)
MKNLRFITGIFGLMLSVFCVSVLGQDDFPGSRSITSLDFKNNRKPKDPGAAIKPSAKPNVQRQKAIAVITNSRRKYNLIKRIAVKKSTGQKIIKPKVEELGVTFWRLRPFETNDEGAPLFPVRVGEKFQDWTAERVASSTNFKKGDRVRFTVESSRTGYLYIANREFYTDGTTGAANIIFPTLRTRGGNNRVEAGSLIEIPSASDSVPYFTIKPRRTDYAGEELIVLILPNELPNFEKTLRAQPVTPENLTKWFADWESLVDVYDAEDGIGTAYTEIEAIAANAASRSLTQEEPLPQTIFRVSLKPSAPMFVAFRMNAENP